MNTQVKIDRVKLAQGLLEDLMSKFKGLEINEAEPESYTHFHDTYPQEVSDTLDKAFELFHDWLDDLNKDLRDELEEAI